jgi:crotonobetainyl-CoA:carnitine CoA-transferase CaiB-like acyl-CoA transferase
MLGMINAQHLWPGFCKALQRPELENDPKFATYEARAQHAEELVDLIESSFRSKTYVEWAEILKTHRIIWSPVMTPLEVTQDEQALANDFFVDWDHPRYGKIKVLNNPIKLSKTPAEIKSKAPDLGEHTDLIMEELGYAPEAIAAMKREGVIA